MEILVLALVFAARICVAFTLAVLTSYAVRHYWMSFTRLKLGTPKDTNELVGFVMPRITVLVPMHNEENVAADVLQALVDCDYDWSRLQIVAINDRSTDNTRSIIDAYARKYPIVHPLHRENGIGGKPAALVEATAIANGEIVLLFDADYIPGRAMLKMLAAPFVDIEVGAVMGRVVPHNIGGSLLAGLLSLERAAGYQSTQQSRFNGGFTAQFGGTVGGVRASALKAVGGWDPSSLTEDTDLTFRLLLHGWQVAYVNRAECYEEVPQSWLVRRRQLVRWVTGHTECLHKYSLRILRAGFLTPREKLDALFLLAMYLTAPVMVLGWLASLVLFFVDSAHEVPILAIAMGFVGYQLFSNQASFLEIGVAAVLDGSRERMLLMPLNLLNFFASTGTICSALAGFYWRKLWGSGGPGWDKTKRTRRPGEGSGGLARGSGARLVSRMSNGLYFSQKQSGK
jgi:cellulose synthase/poly-beta-1,6-N-acetylglucosamine synthase-like glycosyltransferase